MTAMKVLLREISDFNASNGWGVCIWFEFKNSITPRITLDAQEEEAWEIGKRKDLKEFILCLQEAEKLMRRCEDIK
jgi:hypothetical protein